LDLTKYTVLLQVESHDCNEAVSQRRFSLKRLFKLNQDAFFNQDMAQIKGEQIYNGKQTEKNKKT